MRGGILFMLHMSYAFGHVTVGPQNVAVVAGETMSMECRTDEESRVRRWDLLRTDGNTTTIYSPGIPNSFHKEFTHFDAQLDVNGSGILYTNSTKMTDAGLYACITRVTSQSPTIRSTALLTIFESHPICETNLKADLNTSLVLGDYIWFRCNVTYRGFWAPTMEWRRHSVNGDVGTILTDGVEIVRLRNESVIYTLTINMDSSMKGSFFSCRTHFIKYDGKTLDVTANNTPNYTYIWNSEAMDVPNDRVSVTATGSIESTSSSEWTLLVVGLSVFSILLVVLIAVLGVRYKDKIFRRTCRIIRPDVVQHENPLIQGNTYATYDEITFDQTTQRNAEPTQIPAARRVQQERIPIYAQVNKTSVSTGDYEVDIDMPAEMGHQTKTYTGTDGTLYMDVNKFRDGNSRVPVKHPPMFSLVETYASIDHTESVPPLLPSRSQRPN